MWSINRLSSTNTLRVRGSSIVFVDLNSTGFDLTGTTANILAYDNGNIVDQTPAEGDTVRFGVNAFNARFT